MKFQLPVAEGHFLKRYKRFFADINYKNQVVTAHVPNTGSLKSCLNPESLCRFTVSDDPKRKLKYTLQMIKTPTSWVGVNTTIPNQIVWEAFNERSVSSWKKFDGGQKEVKINDKSRIDFVFWKKQKGLAIDTKINLNDFDQFKFHFVEVKNVTLGDQGVAYFPDSVTLRGQKHLQDLIALMAQGHTAEIVFTVQRSDCKEFRPSDNIDPEYGVLLREAKKQGLIISPYVCSLKKSAILLDGTQKLTVKL